MKKTLFAIVLLGVPMASFGGVFYQTSYTVDLTNFPSSITNIAGQEFPGNDYATRYNYLGPDSSIAAANSISTITNPFLNGGPPLTTALLMGIAQDLPNDAPGQQHIVLFVSEDAAPLTVGVNWQDFFPTTDEDTLIATLQQATSGGLNWGNSFDDLAPALLEIGDFLNSLAPPGGLLGPGGIYTSPYFDLPAPTSAATDFEVVAFSTGQIVGSGTVVQDAVDFGSDTPEPSTLLPLLALAAGLVVRRRSL